jgi:hypothetical protein
MSVPYVVRAGREFGEPAKSCQIKSAIVTCAVGAGIGIGLRLLLDADPGIIGGISDALGSVGMAVWNMLRDVAYACAELVGYLIHSRS